MSATRHTALLDADIERVRGTLPGKNIDYVCNRQFPAGGDVPELTPCGQVWDYLYSGDCAEALWHAALSGLDGAIYPLGGGSPKGLREYIEIIRLLINPRAEVRYGALPYPEHQVMRMIADMEPLERDTGYRPATSFHDGILSILKTRDMPPIYRG